LQRALNSIENRLKDTRTELDRKRLVGTENRITDRESRCIFVALNGGTIAFQLDDLSDQLVPSNFYCLVHLGTAHVLSDDQRTGHFPNAAIL